MSSGAGEATSEQDDKTSKMTTTIRETASYNMFLTEALRAIGGKGCPDRSLRETVARNQTPGPSLSAEHARLLQRGVEGFFPPGAVDGPKDFNLVPTSKTGCPNIAVAFIGRHI
jgi:hypothetical protein